VRTPAATAIPARIARIDDKVGSLKAGLFADLFVLTGDGSQPFGTLAQARSEDIQLVLVRGVAIYGTDKLMSQFKVQTETLEGCRTKMALNSAALTAGKFADVRDRLKSDLNKYKLELGQLEECTH
jgi:hypothetical protein